ncbi:flagellar biosynthetic protein FliO [Nitrospira defluvii]|nr:flagellar biosynthetic protein FliO [Nitrospira defluvii]
MADPLDGIVKMISSLLLVLGLILFVAYIAKRFLNSRFSRWRSAPLIQVLSTAYLGPKREISVIEVGQEYLVVGVTPTQISLITRLEGPPMASKPHQEIEDTVTT